MPKLRNHTQKTRRNKQKKKTRKHKLSANHRTATATATAKETPQEPVIKTYSSSYASNMLFDGKNLVVDTKINDRPTEHKVFTIRNLRKENPLGADLITTYLNGNVPETLKNPSTDASPHIHIRPVLTSLSDLGLNRREAANYNHEPSNMNSMRELQLDINDIGNNERFPINQLPIIPSPKTTIM